jgi:hypothetical protein
MHCVECARAYIVLNFRGGLTPVPAELFQTNANFHPDMFAGPVRACSVAKRNGHSFVFVHDALNRTLTLPADEPALWRPVSANEDFPPIPAALYKAPGGQQALVSLLQRRDCCRAAWTLDPEVQRACVRAGARSCADVQRFVRFYATHGRFPGTADPVDTVAACPQSRLEGELRLVDGAACAACRFPISKRQRAAQLACGHLFHAGHWCNVGELHSCPLCQDAVCHDDSLSMLAAAAALPV